MLEFVLVVPCQGAAACGLLSTWLPPRPIEYRRLTGFVFLPPLEDVSGVWESNWLLVLRQFAGTE